MSENGEAINQDDLSALSCNSSLSWAQQELPANLKRNFLSEPIISVKNSNVEKISSDPNFGYVINYDDLCGPWSYPEIPAYQMYDVPLVPKISSWIFITQEDMIYMRKFQDNKEAILTLIGNKVSSSVLFRGINKDIFLQLMWEVFRFTRDNDYNEISISSLLGLFYMTHRYFLSSSRRTAAETYEFFKEGVLLHSVLHPPKSAEIFTPAESWQSLDLFCTLYMRQLALLRLICLPSYQVIITVERVSPRIREEPEKKN